MIEPVRNRRRADHAEQVVRKLVTVNRLRRRYDKGHIRVRQGVEVFIDAVREFLDLRRRTVLRIVMREGNLTHDRRLLAHGEDTVEELARLLVQLDCGGIAFRSNLTAASMNALLDWMAGVRAQPEPDSCAGLAFIGESAVDRATGSSAPFGLSELDRVFQIAAASRYALEQLHREMAAGHALDYSQITQHARWVMDGLASEGRRVTAPVFLSPRATDPVDHATNVFLLAVALLHPYARDARELESFCIAALLHDIGRANVSPNDRLGGTAHAAAEAECHPYLGADALLEVHELPPLAIEVAYAHHLQDGDRGLPAMREMLRPSPVSDAIQIADLIEQRLAHGADCKAMSFPTILSGLMEEPGLLPKQDVIQAYLADLTPTPPGTMVRLESGSIGVVFDVDPNDPERPRVAIIRDSSGHHFEFPTVLDLRDMDDAALGIAEPLPRPARSLSTER